MFVLVAKNKKKQIKGSVRTILKEELVELFKKYKNREFVSGLTACQKCIKQAIWIAWRLGPLELEDNQNELLQHLYEVIQHIIKHIIK